MTLTQLHYIITIAQTKSLNKAWNYIILPKRTWSYADE